MNLTTADIYEHFFKHLWNFYNGIRKKRRKREIPDYLAPATLLELQQVMGRGQQALLHRDATHPAEIRTIHWGRDMGKNLHEIKIYGSVFPRFFLL